MNDHRNEIGSNWGSGTPRTMCEAFPHDSIAGEWGLAEREARQQRRDDVLTVLLLALCFIAGCVAGPFVMPMLVF